MTHNWEVLGLGALLKGPEVSDWCSWDLNLLPFDQKSYAITTELPLPAEKKINTVKEKENLNKYTFKKKKNQEDSYGWKFVLNNVERVKKNQPQNTEWQKGNKIILKR